MLNNHPLALHHAHGTHLGLLTFDDPPTEPRTVGHGMQVSNPRAAQVQYSSSSQADLITNPDNVPTPIAASAAPHNDLTNSAELSLEHPPNSCPPSPAAVPTAQRVARWRSGAVTIARRTTRAAGSFVPAAGGSLPAVVWWCTNICLNIPRCSAANTLRGSQQNLPRAPPPPPVRVSMYHQADMAGCLFLSLCKLGMPPVDGGNSSGTCGLPCRYNLLLYTTAEMVGGRLKLIACYTQFCG